MKKTLRLGTRGSPLALLQAEETQKTLFSSSPEMQAEVEIQIVPILTSGDWRPEQRDQSFRDLGGNKELFTKEIDEALLNGHIDMAVHSMKDVATFLPAGLAIMAMLRRADVRDAFIGRDAHNLSDLPEGAVVGTSSLRRQSQILAHRPDLKVVPIRGNVETRLNKLAAGQVDATLLAMAGLARLGLQDRVSSPLPTDLMLPAAAQGAIGLIAREDDDEVRTILQNVNVRETFICVEAERAFLRKLDGSCHTPIGALARLIPDGSLQLDGMASKADGTWMIRLQASGLSEDAEQIGTELGSRVKEKLPADFFAA